MSGRTDQAAGKVKETAGKLANDEDLEAEGKGQHAAGKVKKTLEDVADTAKGAVDAIKDMSAGKR
jgi:uncharacterized protein YjbJ (UPF0337 family)